MTGPLFALLLAAAAPAAAPASPPADGSAAALPADASALVVLLNPEQETLEVTWRGFVVGFQTALKADAEQSRFFAEHPGLENAIFTAARPIVERSTRDALPRVRAAQARFFASNFKASELQQLLGFYRSATGEKLIAGMYAGVDLEQLASRVQEDTAGQVSVSDIRTLSTGAARRVLPAFTAEDRATLIRFASLPVFPKLRRLLPEVLKLQADEANRVDPALDAELASAIQRVVEATLASHGQPSS